MHYECIYLILFFANLLLIFYLAKKISLINSNLSFNNDKNKILLFYVEFIKTMVEYYKEYFLLQKNYIYDINEMKKKIYEEILKDVNIKKISFDLSLTEKGTKNFIAMLVNEYVEKNEK